MSRRLARRAVDLGVVVAGAVNLLALVCYFGLRSRTGLYRLGEQFPRLSGYELGGRPMPPQGDRACYLLRLTSDDCPYCWADKPQLGALQASARSAGCEEVQIAPKTGLVPLQAGKVQLQYVDAAFARVLDPFLTPQTILLSGTGVVVWYRAGEMDNRSLAEARRALKALP